MDNNVVSLMLCSTIARLVEKTIAFSKYDTDKQPTDGREMTQIKSRSRLGLIGLITVFGLFTNSFGAESKTNHPPVPLCSGTFGPRLGSTVTVLPEPGIEVTAEVGQTMIASQKTDLMDGTKDYFFAVDEPIKLAGRALGQVFTITLLPVKMKMAPGQWYKPDYAFQYANDSEPRTGLSKPDVYVSMALPSLDVVAKAKIGFGEYLVPAGKGTVVANPQCTLTGPDSFQRELVYSGVSKGVVTILYREFNGNTARPAFSQELHFDLGEGYEIGYKGARFKVTKANNVGITYQVTKPLE